MIRMSNEIKAGFVIILGVLAGSYFFYKTVDMTQDTYELRTFFTYAGDLKPNAVVKLSGIEVGRLKELNFVYDGNRTKVECLFEIESYARVREDSIAYIGTAGFVGDAFIGITPGTSADFAVPGSIIASEDPVEMRNIMKKADSIAENLDGILAEVRSVVTDNRPAMDSIVANIEATALNFKEFSEDVKRHPWKLLFRSE